MIARIWRGATRADRADEYLDYLAETGLAAFSATPGNLGSLTLRRSEGDLARWTMLSFWDSMTAVRAFAGDDPERAVFYPRDAEFLVERELDVTHHEVVDRQPGARAAAERWVAGYRRAWESNDPAEIGALFADDAEYLPHPSAEPWRGREAIVAKWLERRDEPGTTTFEWRLLAADGALVFVQGVTTYFDGPVVYDNLWVIRLAPDGRATSFTEWWVKRD